MSNVNRDRKRKRCDSTVGVRYPADVRAALERAAAHDGCSISDIVRKFTLEGLRAAGLIEEPRA
jgi:hypothetical protein